MSNRADSVYFPFLSLQIAKKHKSSLIKWMLYRNKARDNMIPRQFIALNYTWNLAPNLSVHLHLERKKRCVFLCVFALSVKERKKVAIRKSFSCNDLPKAMEMNEGNVKHIVHLSITLRAQYITNVFQIALENIQYIYCSLKLRTLK